MATCWTGEANATRSSRRFRKKASPRLVLFNGGRQVLLAVSAAILVLRLPSLESHDEYAPHMPTTQALGAYKHGKEVRAIFVKDESTEIRKVAEKQPLTIFYNVYFGEKANAIQRSFRIIREQLKQVGRAIDKSPYSRRVRLYYNTIGASTLNETKIKDMCARAGNFTCHAMNHYSKAFEEVTLRQLHGYCVQFDAHSVAYIHNKGSYNKRHPGVNQDAWRRHATDAALSQQCLDAPDNAACSVCGLHWMPFPGQHFPGNFWSAKCSYVKTLLSPKIYMNRVDKFVEQKLVPAFAAGKIIPSMFPQLNPWELGTERFSSEHWVSSHPSVNPCDLSSHEHFWYWQTVERSAAEYAFAKAPRFAVNASYIVTNVAALDDMKNDTARRLQEYYLLPGLVMKWLFLYQQIPPDDSWVWKFYPDGDLWCNASKEYGSAAHEAVWNARRMLPE